MDDNVLHVFRSNDMVATSNCKNKATVATTALQMQILSFFQYNSIYFKTHNIKKTSNTITNNKSHGTNEIQLRNMF